MGPKHIGMGIMVDARLEKGLTVYSYRDYYRSTHTEISTTAYINAGQFITIRIVLLGVNDKETYAIEQPGKWSNIIATTAIDRLTIALIQGIK